MEGLGMLRKPLEASGRLWKVGAELPGARKGEQKLAEAGMSWPGVAGAGRGWKGLAVISEGW